MKTKKKAQAKLISHKVLPCDDYLRIDRAIEYVLLSGEIALAGLRVIVARG
jgi:hypothetical protein